jgi:hypothetical protein
MSRLLRIALVIATVVGASSCGGGETQTARSRSTATIEILEPEANAVITDDKFTVRVKLEGGRIVKEVSRDLTPDEGHLHVSVDGAILTQTYGLIQEIETPTPGKHLLQAEFVAKDHGPFEPRVIASVPFEVEK